MGAGREGVPVTDMLTVVGAHGVAPGTLGQRPIVTKMSLVVQLASLVLLLGGTFAPKYPVSLGGQWGVAGAGKRSIVLKALNVSLQGWTQ